jgi:hypothetical protein
LKLGVTGTRHDLTQAQYAHVASQVRHPVVTEVHHGDCVGFDAVVHDLALRAHKRIVIHPPLNPKQRAFCSGPPERVTILPEADYHVRNHAIVDATEALLAGSATLEEVVRSGTWATVRYARRQARLRTYPIVVIGPDGRQIR